MNFVFRPQCDIPRGSVKVSVAATPVIRNASHQRHFARVASKMSDCMRLLGFSCLILVTPIANKIWHKFSK